MPASGRALSVLRHLRDLRDRTLAVTALIVGAACAHVEAPPGGPEDRVPPAVVTTRPEAEAVVDRYDGPVVFVFDERISERGVVEAVMVSPRTSPVDVRPGRDQVRVSLRRGWEPGTIYHVTLGAEISDLFGNQLAEPVNLVFSTGPEIPATVFSGRVTDRITGRPEGRPRVEAIRTTDSLVYAVPTDADGRFELSRIPEGEYRVRAYVDVNRNRSLEPFEPRDTAQVELRVGDPVEVSLRLLMPDTTPPVARSGTFRQRRIDIEFDDYLDPDQTVDPASIAVVDPTGLRLPIESVRIGPALPATPAPAVPPAVPPAGQPPQPGAAPPTPGVPPPVPPAGGAQQPGAPPATPPSPPAPLPSRTLTIELAEAAELLPETDYVVTVEGIRNVNGLPADAEVTATTPAAPPAPPAPIARVS